MGWFSGRKTPDDRNESKRLADRLKASEQRARRLQEAVKTLLAAVSELAIEDEALSIAEVRRHLEDAARKHRADADLAAFFERWPADAEALAAFARRQQRYITEREAELRQIIALLGRTMVENEAFNQKIFDQGGQIEGLIGLDDIREIKKALQGEASRLKQTVAEKRARDQERVEVLDAEVRHLKTELKKARLDGLRDGLTGVYTREALQRYLDALLRRPTDAGQPASLLLIDIDDFSKFEKVYSARLRDRVVLAIAEQCREFAAHTDFLARYGEGIFAVVLPAVSLREALVKADYLCRTIAATRYSVGEVHDGHQLAFTVSVGVGARLAGDVSASLLARAEKALSMAKAMGRNRAVAQRTGLFPGIRARIGLP